MNFISTVGSYIAPVLYELGKGVVISVAFAFLQSCLRGRVSRQQAEDQAEGLKEREIKAFSKEEAEIIQAIINDINREIFEPSGQKEGELVKPTLMVRDLSLRSPEARAKKIGGLLQGDSRLKALLKSHPKEQVLPHIFKNLRAAEPLLKGVVDGSR